MATANRARSRTQPPPKDRPKDRLDRLLNPFSDQSQSNSFFGNSPSNQTQQSLPSARSYIRDPLPTPATSPSLTAVGAPAKQPTPINPRPTSPQNRRANSLDHGTRDGPDPPAEYDHRSPLSPSSPGEFQPPFAHYPQSRSHPSHLSYSAQQQQMYPPSHMPSSPPLHQQPGFYPLHQSPAPNPAYMSSPPNPPSEPPLSSSPPSSLLNLFFNRSSRKPFTPPRPVAAAAAAFVASVSGRPQTMADQPFAQQTHQPLQFQPQHQGQVGQGQAGSAGGGNSFPLPPRSLAGAALRPVDPMAGYQPAPAAEPAGPQGDALSPTAAPAAGPVRGSSGSPVPDGDPSSTVRSLTQVYDQLKRDEQRIREHIVRRQSSRRTVRRGGGSGGGGSAAEWDVQPGVAGGQQQQPLGWAHEPIGGWQGGDPAAGRGLQLPRRQQQGDMAAVVAPARTSSATAEGVSPPTSELSSPVSFASATATPPPNRVSDEARSNKPQQVPAVAAVAAQDIQSGQGGRSPPGTPPRAQPATANQKTPSPSGQQGPGGTPPRAQELAAPEPPPRTPPRQAPRGAAAAQPVSPGRTAAGSSSAPPLPPKPRDRDRRRMLENADGDERIPAREGSRRIKAKSRSRSKSVKRFRADHALLAAQGGQGEGIPNGVPPKMTMPPELEMALGMLDRAGETYAGAPPLGPGKGGPTIPVVAPTILDDEDPLDDEVGTPVSQGRFPLPMLRSVSATSLHDVGEEGSPKTPAGTDEERGRGRRRGEESGVQQAQPAAKASGWRFSLGGILRRGGSAEVKDEENDGAGVDNRLSMGSDSLASVIDSESPARSRSMAPAIVSREFQMVEVGQGQVAAKTSEGLNQQPQNGKEGSVGTQGQAAQQQQQVVAVQQQQQAPPRTPVRPTVTTVTTPAPVPPATPAAQTGAPIAGAPNGNPYTLLESPTAGDQVVTPSTTSPSTPAPLPSAQLTSASGSIPTGTATVLATAPPASPMVPMFSNVRHEGGSSTGGVQSRIKIVQPAGAPPLPQAIPATPLQPKQSDAKPAEQPAPGASSTAPALSQPPARFPRRAASDLPPPGTDPSATPPPAQLKQTRAQAVAQHDRRTSDASATTLIEQDGSRPNSEVLVHHPALSRRGGGNVMSTVAQVGTSSSLASSTSSVGSKSGGVASFQHAPLGPELSPPKRTSSLSWRPGPGDEGFATKGEDGTVDKPPSGALVGGESGTGNGPKKGRKRFSWLADEDDASGSGKDVDGDGERIFGVFKVTVESGGKAAKVERVASPPQVDTESDEPPMDDFVATFLSPTPALSLPPMLTSLTIVDVPILTLPGALLEALYDTLEQFVWEGCGTETWQEAPEGMKVSVLRCRGNAFRTIPDEVGTWTSLEVVDMSQNKIEWFPNYFFRQTLSILYLDLSDNALSLLPSSLGLLSHIHYLGLEGNPWDTDIVPLIMPAMEAEAALKVAKAGGIPSFGPNRGRHQIAPAAGALPSRDITAGVARRNWRTTASMIPSSAGSTISEPSLANRRLSHSSYTLASSSGILDGASIVEVVDGPTAGRSWSGPVRESGVWDNGRPISTTESGGSSPRSTYVETPSNFNFASYNLPQTPSRASMILPETSNAGYSSSSRSPERSSTSSSSARAPSVLARSLFPPSPNRNSMFYIQEPTSGNIMAPPSHRSNRAAVSDSPLRIIGRTLTDKLPIFNKRPGPPVPISSSIPSVPSLPEPRSMDDVSLGFDTSLGGPTSAISPAVVTRRHRVVRRLAMHLRDVYDLDLEIRRTEEAEREARLRMLIRAQGERTQALMDEEAGMIRGRAGRPLSMASLDSYMSHPSMLLRDPSPSRPVVAKKRKPPSHRHNIIKEILATEKTYVTQLGHLMELYVKPLEGRGADGNKERVLSPEEHRRIFTNVGAIFQLHKDHLLPALEEACIETAPEEHGLKGRIGRAFLQFAPFLKLYGIYATSFEASAKLIERYESDKVDGNGAKLNRASVRRYKEVVARARRDTRHTQLNLQAWMLLPLQRLMRYPLLLKNLLEVTVDGHPDEFELEKALTEVEKRVSEANDRKREWEGVQSVVSGVLRGIRVREADNGYAVADEEPMVPDNVSVYSFDTKRTKSPATAAWPAPGSRSSADNESVTMTISSSAFITSGSDLLKLTTSRRRLLRSAKWRVVRVVVKAECPDSVIAYFLDAYDPSGRSGPRMGRPAASIKRVGGRLKESIVTVISSDGEVGREDMFLLFTDALVWCKVGMDAGVAGPGQKGSYTLIRAFDLDRAGDKERGIARVVDSRDMPTSVPGMRWDDPPSVAAMASPSASVGSNGSGSYSAGDKLLRVSDPGGEVVVYLAPIKGADTELVQWMEELNNSP